MPSPAVARHRVDQARERRAPGAGEVVAACRSARAARAPAPGPRCAAASAGACSPALLTTHARMQLHRFVAADLEFEAVADRGAAAAPGSCSASIAPCASASPCNASIRPWLSMMPVDGDSTAAVQRSAAPARSPARRSSHCRSCTPLARRALHQALQRCALCAARWPRPACRSGDARRRALRSSRRAARARARTAAPSASRAGSTGRRG